jgi:hypothetical protein
MLCGAHTSLKLQSAIHSRQGALLCTWADTAHFCVCTFAAVRAVQGLEFIADNKEEQSRTLLGNVASINDELQGLVASLHTGAAMRWFINHRQVLFDAAPHVCAPATLDRT